MHRSTVYTAEIALKDHIEIIIGNTRAIYSLYEILVNREFDENRRQFMCQISSKICDNCHTDCRTDKARFSKRGKVYKSKPSISFDNGLPFHP